MRACSSTAVLAVGTHPDDVAPARGSALGDGHRDVSRAGGCAPLLPREV